MGKIAWMVKPKNRTEKQIIKVITNTISAIQKTITVFLQGIYMVFLWDQADVQQIARLTAKLFILIYQIVNLILGTKTADSMSACYGRGSRIFSPECLKHANSYFDVSKWKIDSAVNFFDTGLDCNEGFEFIKEQLNQKTTIDLNETDELEKLKGFVLIG